MLWLYNFGISLYKLLLQVASLFNPKAKLFLKGRKNLLHTISKRINPSEKHIWFHFASLGEFEQGRPVLENLKKNYPDKKIVITFFSPSGYEIRKDYAGAEGVFYLPLDTKKNAEEFVRIINPEIAIFTKYEFWHHYFSVLHRHNVPLFLISGIFRPSQLFFKWYGGFYRSMLTCVNYFFVQNEESVRLLNSIHIENVSLSGDTRFDRVAENAQSPKHLQAIADFCGSSKVFIAGSTWPQDEQLIATLIRENPDWKFIIAPHEIGAAHLDEIINLIPGMIRYTHLEGSNLNSKVLLIDNIGMLSSIYQYATIAYIGGGFGAGIHNTLEAAAFGSPVIFGPKYDKFQEAKDLIRLGAAISISSSTALSAAFTKLQQDNHAGIAARNYVDIKKGSTEQILEHLKDFI